MIQCQAVLSWIKLDPISTFWKV